MQSCSLYVGRVGQKFRFPRDFIRFWLVWHTNFLILHCLTLYHGKLLCRDRRVLRFFGYHVMKCFGWNGLELTIVSFDEYGQSQGPRWIIVGFKAIFIKWAGRQLQEEFSTVRLISSGSFIREVFIQLVWCLRSSVFSSFHSKPVHLGAK